MKQEPLRSHQDLCIRGQSLDTFFPEAVLPSLQVASYKKGEVIALAGQEVPYLFVVLSGCGVVKSLGDQGQETILGYVYAGDLIGEIEIYTHNVFLHYVYADSAVDLLLIPIQRVEEELAQYVPFLRFVMDGAFVKLMNRTTYFSDTRLYGHKERTITYIKDLYQRLQVNRIPFVMSEVAPFIGVSERQLRRIIRDLEEEGWVTKRYRELEIHSLMEED